MMARTKKRWRYVTRGVEGHALKLDGVNVWAFEWTTIPGLKARVKDPLYRQNFLFDVFEIRAGEQVIHFAAGEFSSNVWGFYVEE